MGRSVALLLTIFWAISACAERVRGVVLTPAGKPAIGVQIYASDPRVGARTDAKGTFTLDVAPGITLYATSGLALGQASATRGSITIRLDAVDSLTPDARRELGVSLLLATAEKASIYRPKALGWLAESDPKAALRLARGEGERGGVLVALARLHPEQGEALAQQADALPDNFERCRTAEGVALACLKTNPLAARQAFDTVRAIWKSGAVGGTDLHFPYATLAVRFAPSEAEAIVRDADGWARRSATPDEEQTQFALMLSRVDIAPACQQALRLPAPMVPIALARLAEALATSDPASARGFLDEARRLESPGPGFEVARARAVAALLRTLGTRQPDVSFALAKGESSEEAIAWRTRLEPQLTPESRGMVYRARMLSAPLEATIGIVDVAQGDSPKAGQACLGVLRTRIFQALDSGPVPPDVVIAFARRIASLDPAAARAALERTFNDLHRNAVKQASVAEAMALIDPLRALALADSMENPDWPHMARGRIGAYLAYKRWPDPVR